MRKLITSFLLLVSIGQAFASPLVTNFRNGLISPLPQGSTPVDGFASCDASRALPTALLSALDAKFQSIETGHYAFPQLITLPMRMTLVPNSKGLTSTVPDGGYLTVGASYDLKSPFEIVPGVRITEVGQTVIAVPPQAMVGVMYRFETDAVVALEKIETATYIQMRPRVVGAPSASFNGVWFSVDQNLRTVWCWRRLPLPKAKG